MSPHRITSLVEAIAPSLWKGLAVHSFECAGSLITEGSRREKGTKRMVVTLEGKVLLHFGDNRVGQQGC